MSDLTGRQDIKEWLIKYKDNFYSLFDCKEVECVKYWDGDTEKDVTRLHSLPSTHPLDPCETCLHKGKSWDEEPCDGCTREESGYEEGKHEAD